MPGSWLDKLRARCTGKAGATVHLINPWFGARLAAGLDLAEERYGLKPPIVSTVRTHAEQAALYAKYKAGKGPVAADPNRVGRDGRKGSNHMEQRGVTATVQAASGGVYEYEGYGHACDVSASALPGRPWQKLDECRVEHGTILTVGVNRGPNGRTTSIKPGGEDWHVEFWPGWKPPSVLHTLVHASLLIKAFPGCPDTDDPRELVSFFQKLSQGVQQRPITGNLDEAEWRILVMTAQAVGRLGR
jgi:hypothetical protein